MVFMPGATAGDALALEWLLKRRGKLPAPARGAAVGGGGGGGDGGGAAAGAGRPGLSRGVRRRVACLAAAVAHPRFADRPVRVRL